VRKKRNIKIESPGNGKHERKVACKMSSNRSKETDGWDSKKPENVTGQRYTRVS